MELLRAQKGLIKVIDQSANAIEEVPANRWTEGLIESRLQVIGAYWRDFQLNHVRLLSEEHPDITAYLESDAYTDTEAAFIRAQGRLFDRRTMLNLNNQVIPREGGIHATHATERTTARLPRITIPSFSGNLQEWESFRDMFTSLIHNDPTLDQVGKLYYLKTHVEGDAATAIQNFPVTDANYTPAWNALMTRFNQLKLLVQDHLKALLNMRQLREESSTGLQHLLDDITRHRNQLEVLGRPVATWDDWFIFLTATAMDDTTRRAWEEESEELHKNESSSEEIYATFDDLERFLLQRCRTLKAMETGRTLQSSSIKKNLANTTSTVRTHATTSNQHQYKGCPACNNPHYIGHCAKYNDEMSPSERRDFIIRNALCFNCLRSRHVAKYCHSQSTCRICKNKDTEPHNTSIHDVCVKAKSKNFNSDEPEAKKAKIERQVQVAATHTKISKNEFPQKLTILPTAVIIISDGRIREERVRALLDPCSDETLIDLNLARKLGTPLTRVNVQIAGVSGSSITSARFHTRLFLRNPLQENLLPVEAYGLQSVGITTPSQLIQTTFNSDIPLADPDFATPRRIDIVLAANIYSQILLPGIFQINALLAQQTIFGWVLTGQACQENSMNIHSNACVTTKTPIIDLTHEQLVGLVQRFWALEEIPKVNRKSAADRECEEFYVNHHSRDDTGRYIVPLPLKKDGISLLGESLSQARLVLQAAHRRMQRDPKLQQEYCRFMTEYEELGHMRRLSPTEVENIQHPINYIPHHGIWQRSDKGEKLRVVFNASRPTSSGRSLNDVLHAGPNFNQTCQL